MKSKVVVNCNRATASVGASKGFRINGRTPNEFRIPQLSFGKTSGSCEVLLQPSTRIYVQISSSIGEPMDSRPGEGILTISAWISPTATGEMGGGGSQKPALIARSIEKLFKEHRVVDLESLCIKYGEKVWVLRADIHILDMNGCLVEAAALAVLGGLLTFRRPEAFIDKETDQLVVLTMEQSNPVKLYLHHIPVLTSFAITSVNTILVEPDQEEEEVFSGKLQIGVNDNKELCYLHLTYPIPSPILAEATRMAQVKCLERIEWIKTLAAAAIESRSTQISNHENESVKLQGKRFKIPSSYLPKKMPSNADLEVMKDLSITESKVEKSSPKKTKTDKEDKVQQKKVKA